MAVRLQYLQHKWLWAIHWTHALNTHTTPGHWPLPFQRVNINSHWLEYKTGTMVGFDKSFSASTYGLEAVPVFLVELDDGRKVKTNIRSGASMLKGKKVEVMETSNTQTGISNFELVRCLDENN